jgi:arylsulfatase A-like enzyme
MGIGAVAHRHFLDPAFVGYSITVNVAIQIVILLLALALAFVTRRKLWSAVLFAIAFFCFLAIPGAFKLFLPGVAHPLAWCIAVLAAFQITRTVNRHRHSRIWSWMIAVPALTAICTLSYGRVLEYSRMSSLPAPPTSPNVLIIIVDALRSDELSPYGYARDTSPFVNQLAQQGVLFENAIAPSSWTLPSHASMLTGLYPHQSLVQTDKDTLSGRWPTLGDAMRKRGYRTAAFSANVLYFSTARGFAHGFSHFEDYQQNVLGILQMVPLSEFILAKLNRPKIQESLGYFSAKSNPSAEKIDQDALAWIDHGNRPFFVVLNYFDVHEPVLPPRPYLDMYTTDPHAGRLSIHFAATCAWFDADAVCNSHQSLFVDTYDGATRYVDASTEQLLSQLKKRGLLQNTIVVFTSDHGQEFGDHGIYGHGKSLYRPVIQVPLILWKPGLIPASTRIPTPVSTTDIPATILDLTAADNKQALPGQSLAALWRSSEAGTNWPAPISELARLHWSDRTAPNYNTPASSIVTPEWHFIHQDGKDLLFDWKADHDEQHDICAAQPAVCSTLKSQMQTDESSLRQAH